MAVMTVNTAADVVDAADGVLSLREAIALANASPEDDTIVFAPEAGFFIAANSSANPAPLEIHAEGGRLTILGDRDNDGQADVALGGGFAHRFTVHVGAELVLVGIDITGANGQSPGVAAKGDDGARGARGSVAPGPTPISHFSVDVNGNDLLEDAERARILAYFGQNGADAAPAGAGGDGQAGAAGETRAGAILNRGTLTLVRVGFSDNRAVAGQGGQGGRGGDGGFAVAGGSGIEGHQLESPGRPVSMPLSQYEVEPYWMWVGPGDGGKGGAGGADGGDGGAGAGVARRPSRRTIQRLASRNGPTWPKARARPSAVSRPNRSSAQPAASGPA
jgi:CSLREA domain-containing protein